MLRLGAGAAVGAAGAYARVDVLSTPATAPPVAMTASPPARPARARRAAAAAAPTYVTGSFVSAARGGRHDQLGDRAPARPDRHRLRPVIALHGKGRDAAEVMAEAAWSRAWPRRFARASPPFAVVAVDGGDGYWHKRASGEDSGAMVLDELIPMLSDQGLDTSRVGFLGWSMGGYGALLLGARLGPARTAAICAVSPALWTSSGATAPGAFDGADDYAANSVWGLPALGSIPIRIDCGNERSVLRGDQAVHRPAAHPARGRLLPGRPRRLSSGVRSCPPRSLGWHRCSSPDDER